MGSSQLAVLSTARSILTRLCALGVLTRVSRAWAERPSLTITLEGARRPYFLGGARRDFRNDVSDADAPVAAHTVDGPGLHAASTGRPSSFTIRLGGDGNTTAPPEGGWDIGPRHFMYVSIVSTDHVFSAVVEDNGDGTLTATYESPFPGEYLIFVQEVDVRKHCSALMDEAERARRARPIQGSPFSLTISGKVTMDVQGMDVCGTEGYVEDAASIFWRTGSWVTSKFASAEHGVLRDGWVFQPNDCVHDTFNHTDVMLLAGMEEPTWFLVAGNSIQRGVFQALVDLLLATGQKNEFDSSIVYKCWGMVDVQIGNLRVTYQDLRLYEIQKASEDSVVCHGNVLVTNSTAEYISASERFFKETVFKENGPWPTVIMAPSHMVDTDEAPNPQINVLLDALPTDWHGSIVMMEHMAGLGYFFDYENPTALSLAEVKPLNQMQQAASADNGLRKREDFQSRDPRLTFMSAFPMYQSMMFDGERSRPGKPCYGCSPHYHYVIGPDSPEAEHGAMVHSDVNEMLANIFIAKAVGTKAAVYEKAAGLVTAGRPKLEEQPQFKVCADCPATLLPFHVKAVPDVTCAMETSLPGDAEMGAAWGGTECPLWCYEGDTTYVFSFMDVRICPLEGSYLRS